MAIMGYDQPSVLNYLSLFLVILPDASLCLCSCVHSGSGGGKSTLMDILSGRKSLGKLSGEMSVLGESMSPKDSDCKEVLRDITAYVPQNEQFFPVSCYLRIQSVFRY